MSGSIGVAAVRDGVSVDWVDFASHSDRMLSRLGARPINRQLVSHRVSLTATSQSQTDRFDPELLN